MYCMNCGAPIDREVSECPHCGESPFLSPRTAPKKHHPILIPILLMAGMLAVGLNLFFRIPLYTGQDGSPSDTTDTPSENEIWEGCFTLIDGTLYFDPYFYTGSSVLDVPETIGGETVTAIGDYCFYGCDTLTTINLPDTVTSIGTEAFAYCTSLRGMALPLQIVSIGDGAFYGCGELEALSVPAFLHSVGADAFDDCYSLRYIFYDGYFERWDAMYGEYISPFTYVICTDGDYRQGAYSS